MRLPIVLAVAAALAAAGCVTMPDVDLASAALGSDGMANVRALLAGVPCEAAVGAGTSENLKELALLPFDGSEHAELDAKGHLVLVAAYQNGGFEVVNVSDPTTPALVGTYVPEKATTALDVKWLATRDAAVLGIGKGIEVVDLSDPTNPMLLSTWTFADAKLTGSSHMVDTFVIGGVEHVFIAPSNDKGVYILALEGDALKHVGTYKHPVLSGGPLGPHDMTVLLDETLQKPLLYVANGFEGWLVADVSDPTKPAHLGGMLNVDPAQGYLHTIQAAKIGSKRIVTTVSEVGVNAVKVWDATDISKPLLLAEWIADKTSPTLPNHNLQLLNGMLYVAHYGKGVYVFNLTGAPSWTPYAGSLSMKPVAHYAPPSPKAAAVPATAFVNVWDVILVDGVLFVNDMEEGLHSVGFGCLVPGDASQTSRG